MKLSWQPARRKPERIGGFQLRDQVNDEYWYAWVAHEPLLPYRRGKDKQPLPSYWYLWLAPAAADDEVLVQYSAKYKSLRKAMRAAEAAVRIG